MEMWKIYYGILALHICAANAESTGHMTNSHGDGDKHKKINQMVIFPQDHFNINENKRTEFNVPQSKRIFNTNSKDSFGDFNKNTGIETILRDEFKSSTKFPAFNNNFKCKNKFTGELSFNARLFEILSSSAQNKNLVFSPLSLQTLLAFIFTMSSGKLNKELVQLLQVPNNLDYVAQLFENILQKASAKTPPNSVIMANKLYYDYHFGTIDSSINVLAKNSFACELEQMDFATSTKAANIINGWVKERTRNLIQDIVTPSSITEDTKALLLNSIYFKSDWLIKFAIYDTEIQPFHVTRSQQVPVEMMYNEDVFRYGDFTEDLQASVVELPYNDTNLTMLFILPNDMEGLAELESKLGCYDIVAMAQKLKREIVTVKMPKFKIEYETDMIQTLQQMGLNALFNNEGVINLFKNQQKPLKVDQFKHKAFINVNEAGTEAAAVSVAKYVPLSLPVNMKYFTADHPFVFIIKDDSTTLFMGHVKQF